MVVWSETRPPYVTSCEGVDVERATDDILEMIPKFSSPLQKEQLLSTFLQAIPFEVRALGGLRFSVLTCTYIRGVFNDVHLYTDLY